MKIYYINKLKMNYINNLPIYQVIAGTALISISPLFVKYSQSDPIVIGFYRMLIGAIFLIVLGIFNSGRSAIFGNKKAYYYAFVCAIFISLDIIFWHKSIKLIGPGLATLFNNSYVLFLVIIGIFFYKEKININILISLISSMCAFILLTKVNVGVDNNKNMIGIYLGIISAIFNGFYVIFLKKARSISDPLPVGFNLALISFFSAIILGVAAYAEHENFSIFTADNFMWLILYALFSQVFGWVLISKGLTHIGITLAGFLLMIETCLTIILDVTLLKHVLNFVEIVAILLFLFSIFMSSSIRVNKG